RAGGPGRAGHAEPHRPLAPPARGTSHPGARGGAFPELARARSLGRGQREVALPPAWSSGARTRALHRGSGAPPARVPRRAEAPRRCVEVSDAPYPCLRRSDPGLSRAAPTTRSGGDAQVLSTWAHGAVAPPARSLVTELDASLDPSDKGHDRWATSSI